MAEVYYSTNRKPGRKKSADDFGTGFSDDGLANLGFGMAEVGGEYPDQFEIPVAPERLSTDYQRKIRGAGGRVFGSSNLFRRVREKMVIHSRGTIVFVHGYNVSFHEASPAPCVPSSGFRPRMAGRESTR